MLKLQDTHGASYALMHAWLPDGLPGFDYFFTQRLPGSYDPFLAALKYTSHYSIGYHRVTDLLHAYSPVGDATDSVLTTKPEVRAYSSSADYQKYGGSLHGLGLFYRVLAGKNGFPFNPKNEHGVVHYTYSGLAAPSHGGELAWPNPYAPVRLIDPLGFEVTDGSLYLTPRACFNGTPISVFPETSFGGTDFFINYSQEAAGVNDPCGFHPGHDVDDMLSLFSAECGSPIGHVWTGFVSGVNALVRVADFRFSRTLLGFDVEYYLELNVIGYRIVTDHIHISVMSDLSYRPPDHFLVSDVIESVDVECATRLTYVDTLLSSSGSYPDFDLEGRSFGTPNTQMVEIVPTVFFWTKPARDGVALGYALAANYIRRDGILSSFRVEVEKYAADIRCSAYQASADAEQDLVGSLRIDNLQTIIKIGDIGRALPRVAPLIEAVITATSHPLASIREILKFISSSHLQLSFTYRSEYALLRETLPKMVSVLSELNARSNYPGVGRGEFRYHFPKGEFGRESTELVSRCRLVTDSDSQRILTQLFFGDSLGLLPTPAVLWDLTPFSFVVNWFTGIGTRIVDLQSNLVLHLLGLQVVTNSFRLESPLTSVELERYKIEIRDPSRPPALVAYVREVSSYVPLPRDGRYDFRMPTSLPFWLTPASLIFQLFG